MVGQLVEITNPGHKLSKVRGFLSVEHSGEQVGRVPLDDIMAVLVSVPGCTVSSALMEALALRNTPLVLCGRNYMPTCWTLPVQGALRQFQVMRGQAALSEPRRKRLWQAIVRRKIRNQADVLVMLNQPHQHLRRMMGKVRSGDPDNIEAQAARAYWQRLFGDQFRRDRQSSGINAALNYGYTVLRACIARATLGAGMHPSFSLHHRNPQNPFNLVDDLIEPYRPIVDLLVSREACSYSDDLTEGNKARLAALVTTPLPTDEGTSPLSMSALRMCRSVAGYCQGDAIGEVTPRLPEVGELA